MESITGSIKDKAKSVKEKTVDRLDNDEHQQQMKGKRFDQDIQTSTDTNNLNRENQEKELNRNTDRGDKSDENSTNVDSSFTCEKCNTKFTSRQDLKEHFSSQH